MFIKWKGWQRKKPVQRDWSGIQIGDTVKAKTFVPAVLEHAIQFDKGEIATVFELSEKSIGIKDRFNDVSYFSRSEQGIDFIGKWFE